MQLLKSFRVVSAQACY